MIKFIAGLFLLFFSFNSYALLFEGKLPDEGYIKIEIDTFTLSWQMLINYIPNVRATHLHCASTKEIGVTFLPGLSRGSVAVPDKDNKCGWKTIEDVKKAILANNVYADLHTITEVPLSMTGVAKL